MAQTYKMMLGTSGKQWEQLTVKDDGTMMLYFHGTNQSVTQEVTVIAEGEWKGWLRSEKGSMWPGLESGKWQMRADVRGLRADVVETTTFAIKREQGDTCINHAEREQSQDCESSVNGTNSANEVAEPETTTDCTFERPRQSGKRLTPRGKKITTTDCTDDTDNEPVIVNQPRPRRQRKPRKPRVERQPSAISHQPSDIDRHQSSATLKALGMVAAATVALFVIYETGLLIPLGLIGLATGGILK